MKIFKSSFMVNSCSIISCQKNFARKILREPMIFVEPCIVDDEKGFCFCGCFCRKKIGFLLRKVELGQVLWEIYCSWLQDKINTKVRQTSWNFLSQSQFRMICLIQQNSRTKNCHAAPGRTMKCTTLLRIGIFRARSLVCSFNLEWCRCKISFLMFFQFEQISSSRSGFSRDLDFTLLIFTI